MKDDTHRRFITSSRFFEDNRLNYDRNRSNKNLGTCASTGRAPIPGIVISQRPVSSLAASPSISRVTSAFGSCLL